MKIDKTIVVLAGMGGIATAIAGNSAAQAETLHYESSGVAAQAAWTTCPELPPAGGTYCGYTEASVGQGSLFQPFVSMTFALLFYTETGEVQVRVAVFGVINPSPWVTIYDNLTYASGWGFADLYRAGTCTEPGNLQSCERVGTGGISVAWSGGSETTSWTDTRTASAPGNIQFSFSQPQASRNANAVIYPLVNGQAWQAGRLLYARMIRFGNDATLQCPGACPQPTVEAIQAAFQSR